MMYSLEQAFIRRKQQIIVGKNIENNFKEGKVLYVES